MALKEIVGQKIAGTPHDAELLALWERVWRAYADGGAKAVAEALDTLRDEVESEEER